MEWEHAFFNEPGLTTFEMEEIMRYKLKGASNKYFKGVFAINHLIDNSDSMNELSACCIVNTMPSWNVGKHWLAIINEYNHLRVMDPLGFSPDSSEGKSLWPIWNKIARKLHMEVVVCQMPLQVPRSPVCGHICVHYLCSRIQGQDHESYISTYQKDKVTLAYKAVEFVKNGSS